MSQTPINDNLTTRIIPGLRSAYEIVSLPYWAWYWLEDFMRENRISYQGIYKTFGETQDINNTLRHLAEIHHEHAMREIYKLANDNELSDENIMRKIERQKNKATPQEIRLPKIYKLFGFMPCATTLEAVWERRHYEDSNRIL